MIAATEDASNSRGTTMKLTYIGHAKALFEMDMMVHVKDGVSDEKLAQLYANMSKVLDSEEEGLWYVGKSFPGSFEARSRAKV